MFSSFPFRIELDLAKPSLNARDTSVQISCLALVAEETNTALPFKKPRWGMQIFFTKTARGSCFVTGPRVGRISWQELPWRLAELEGCWIVRNSVQKQTHLAAWLFGRS